MAKKKTIYLPQFNLVAIKLIAMKKQIIIISEANRKNFKLCCVLLVISKAKVQPPASPWPLETSHAT